jgi:phosphopantothenoylcysteine decarboxylase/phosphopantothenate--cysteine ligase
MSDLKGRNVVLGVTGSIASYKAADIASKLSQSGALVDVILTPAAQQFVSSLTFRSLTHRSVVTDMLDADSELAVEHVALAERADVVLIAPATANTIAKLAYGFVDDALTATVLATTAPVVIAPAMDAKMYQSPVTDENIKRLEKRGYSFVGPGVGNLASGLTGPGRLVDTVEILNAVSDTLSPDQDLAGLRIVVSAGGTEEPIDPVRHITNRSSGKQGYGIAQAARDRGAQVTLVSAPTALAPVDGVNMVNVTSARTMLDAVQEACKDADALVMAAAVADWEPAEFAQQKMKKVKGQDRLILELKKTPDILFEVRNEDLIKVGFAAESENLIANATDKLQNKNLDFIVANDITASDAGFNVDTNRVVILDKAGGREDLPLLLKEKVGDHILDRIKLIRAQGEK